MGQSCGGLDARSGWQALRAARVGRSLRSGLRLRPDPRWPGRLRHTRSCTARRRRTASCTWTRRFSRRATGASTAPRRNFRAAAGSIVWTRPAISSSCTVSTAATEGFGPSALIEIGGAFYGVTNGQGGGANIGTLFRMDAGGVVTVLHHFTTTEGALFLGITPRGERRFSLRDDDQLRRERPRNRVQVGSLGQRDRGAQLRRGRGHLRRHARRGRRRSAVRHGGIRRSLRQWDGVSRRRFGGAHDAPFFRRRRRRRGSRRSIPRFGR